MERILCAGEALIDMLPREAEGRPAFAPHVGGAVFNTAVALARLGVATSFVSGLSTDLFGRMLTDALDRDGVDHALAARSDRPTTLAFVTLNAGQASYAFYDENTAGRMLSPADMPMDATPLAAFFGGISLAVEPCAVAYEALCLGLPASVPVMLDPNVRTGFIADEAAYRTRIDRMLARADIVKVSDEDLAWLLGDGATAEDLLSRGPKLVCVTRGAKGVTGTTPREEVHVAAERVTVADTVGAGDTFNAGLLAALARGRLLAAEGLERLSAEDLREALSLGTKAAAVTVSRPGADPPYAGEVGV